MSEDEVKQLMESSKSEKEWNENCDSVKAAFDGNYPGFWYPLIVQSGLLSRVAASFGSDPGIKVTTF